MAPEVCPYNIIGLENYLWTRYYYIELMSCCIPYCSWSKGEIAKYIVCSHSHRVLFDVIHACSFVMVDKNGRSVKTIIAHIYLPLIL